MRLEYLSSYAYENISREEQYDNRSRVSGWLLLPWGAERKTMLGGSQGWLETTRRALSR